MVIGIAGYMGAGKSTAARALAEGSSCIVDGDTAAKKLMVSDPQIKSQLAACFGSSIIEQGAIRFDLLSRQAFHSRETLRALNAIVHPTLLAVLRDTLDACSQKVRILDAALIPLWKIEHWFDRLIWVDAPFTARFERLALRRPDLSPEELQRRMLLQQDLFAVPSGPLWTYIENEKYINSLEERILALKHPLTPPGE